MSQLVVHPTPYLRGFPRDWQCRENIRARGIPAGDNSAAKRSSFSGNLKNGDKRPPTVKHDDKVATPRKKKIRNSKQRIEYEALDRTRRETRLLHIEPGKGNETINCHFHVVSFLDRTIPRYEAISYCWLESATEYELAASKLNSNGPTESPALAARAAKIPRTALSALARVRRPNQLSLVWIDAICINQRDIDERNSQVPLMGLIYRHATRTIAWLGDLGDASLARDAVYSLQAISNMRFTKRWLNDQHPKHPQGRVPIKRHPEIVSAPKGCNIKALDAVFSAHWHTRAWIQQEVALARKVTMMVGNSEIDWRRAYEAAVVINFYAELAIELNLSPTAQRGSSSCWGLGSCIKPYSEPPDAQALEVLLTVGHPLISTDPRDKVYALLGLTRWDPDRIPDLLMPDYKRPVREVYRDATKAAIIEYQSLTILTMAMHSKTEDSSLPEGCTWSIKFDERAGDVMPTVIYSATANLRADVDLIVDCGDPGILRLKGFVLDEVNNAALIDWGSWKHWVGIVEFTGMFLSKIDNEEPRLDWVARLLRVLSMDCNPRLRRRYHYKDFAQDITSLMQLMPAMKTNQYPDAIHSQPAKVLLEFCACLEELYSQRRYRCLFTSRDGRMGVGPANLRKGDVVAALYGGDALYALRQEEKGYRYVGDCYLDGFMDGEALEYKTQVGIEDKIFDLR